MRRHYVLAALALGLAAATVPPGVKAQGTLTLVTTAPGNYTVALRGMSADGSRLFFESNNPITPADVDNGVDVYEASNGTMTLLTGGAAGGAGIFPATFKCASPDGSKVVFETGENLPGDGDFTTDVYLAANGAITLLTGSRDSHAAAFRGASADCSIVFFETAEDITPADDDSSLDLYKVDVATGVITLLSGGNSGTTPAFFSGASADGSKVFFRTTEPLGDSDTLFDVYQASGGGITLVTPGTLQVAAYAGSSADGSVVFILSGEQLGAGDTNSAIDLYAAANGGYTLVSSGAPGSSGASFLGSSADGGIVFFQSSDAIDVADVDTAPDIYQNAGGTISLLSGGTTNDQPIFRFATSDGSTVIFDALERLDPADVDSAFDVYQASGGVLTLLTPGTTNNYELFKGTSTDGAVVFFETAEALVATDTNSALDIYATVDGAIAAVSQGPNVGFWQGATPDGTLAFFSTAAQLLPEDADAFIDVYGTTVQADKDAEPPVVTVAVDAADGLAPSNWYNLTSSGSNGVLVHVSATDDSGVTNVSATDGGVTVLNVAASSGSFTLLDGQHSIGASATDSLANAGAGAGSTSMPVLIRVDQTGPAITCTHPTVFLNSTAPVVIANVTDATSGPAAANVSIVPAATTVGLKTATATGDDVAGNQTTLTCDYRVVYQFTGFDAPVSVPPNNYVVAAVAKNIPLRFSIRDAQNNPVIGLSSKAVIDTDTLSNTLCAGAHLTLAASDYPKGKSALNELGNGNYEYRWKAPKAEAGSCRAFSLDLGDGLPHTIGVQLTP